MESNSGDKSRREKRKEARLVKQKNRFLSWMEHQKSKKSMRDLKRQTQKTSKPIVNEISEMSEVQNLFTNNKRDGSDDETSLSRKSKSKVDSLEEVVSIIPKKGKEKDGMKRKSKSKFEEYLEMEMKKGGVSAQEDLELERKLAKKLKVKGGKLRGIDDGMDMFFDGIPSFIDTLTDEEAQDVEDDGKNAKQTSRKKRKRKKLSNVSKQELEEEVMVDKAIEESGLLSSSATEVAIEKSSEKPPAVDASARYVAPHLRSRAANESEEFIRIRRQVRGLLNRLSESNVESITEEISTILRSVSRSVGSQIVTEEVLASCSGGPRGNEQYAAVFASFVAGMACLVGVDFGAKLLASLAKSFEDEFLKEDNLSLRNLTLLLSYLCIFGVCSSDLIYDFLTILSKRLMEIDVSTILTILQCCGMKLRGDDPAAMKDFIVSIQNRVSELKSSSGDQPINNKRMEFMLDTICDIKNNKKRSKEDPVQHTRIKKWLQKLRVEDVLLRGLKWNKLLDPNKKGQWWLSGDVASSTDKVEELATTLNKEVLEAQKLLQLAASQRMNTDARRAIFCVVMSGEDYIDAFEKLLRLDLPGKQDREIMRVIVECCLQEKVFNKYYTILASKLCSHDKNHKFTLQYCLWDHYKGLDEMELIRSKNLSRFVAEMLSTYSLSLAVLKTNDFSDPVQLTPKRIMHFRMLFETIFEQSDALIWNIFTRIAITPELETLRNNLEFFIKQYTVSCNKNISVKFKIAKKAMNNVAGVLM
ncbi:MIF4G-like [Macleaya cordata]|uniref:MIF4G-like n=1 Tax=Macleaya cordata TaxID=56857 RepID=A0A200R1A2_MACCD|nr:MIF4G-like [Macleaya cordata]